MFVSFATLRPVLQARNSVRAMFGTRKTLVDRTFFFVGSAAALTVCAAFAASFHIFR
jgi:hypothetical protein